MPTDENTALILIVDDNADNRDLLSRRLERKGYSCRTASNGPDAINMVYEMSPDLVLLDIMMPGMDGSEVLTILRKRYNPVELPVLMVTSRNADEDIVDAFEKGANDYIEKPSEFPVMLARIRHHLQHKRLDDELKRKNRMLDISNRHKINFLSSMSHELRTPLNAVLGYSEVLLEGMMGELNEKQKEYCREIYDSGAYLLIIINDLLDLSKIEAGKLALEVQSTHLEALVAGVVGMMREKALRNDINLLINVQPDLGAAQLDPLRIKQVLINLLTNAIKFTDPGKDVRLDVGIENENIIINVTDHGCGIAEEDVERIFLPFEQAESPMQKKAVEGTGLGLALVDKLAVLHGGKVNVTSKPGTGSRFTVTLPYIPTP